MMPYTDHKIALMELVDTKYVAERNLMKREIYMCFKTYLPFSTCLDLGFENNF